MAERKAKEYINRAGEKEAKAYANNFRTHRPGISMIEMSKSYTDWAPRYEEDICENIFIGPKLVADSVAELFIADREKVKILDVAAGTGYVGEKLWQKGFRCIDGLDPSKGMLDIAREKGVYDKFICDYITSEKLNIKKDTYDVITISGGFGEGHIPCGALYEMIRLVKPGGFIVIATREEYLQHVEEYKDRLEPLMKELEVSGKWKNISREIIPNYSFDNNGILTKYKVC